MFDFGVQANLESFLFYEVSTVVSSSESLSTIPVAILRGSDLRIFSGHG